MALLSFLFQQAKNTPVILAGNREEAPDRPTQHPKIQSGTPRSICGVDRQSNGTWLGVNQHGLMATLSNCPKRRTPAEPRSRGLLCRSLLSQTNAHDAVDQAFSELKSGKYNGANYLIADYDYAAVVLGGDDVEVIQLEPGLHILSEAGLNNTSDLRQEFLRRMLTLQRLDSSVTFLALASKTFSRLPDEQGRRGIVRLDGPTVTVSSSLLTLSHRLQSCMLQYTPCAPHERAYDDLSALLRQVLSTDKSRRQQFAEEDDYDDLLLADD